MPPAWSALRARLQPEVTRSGRRAPAQQTRPAQRAAAEHGAESGDPGMRSDSGNTVSVWMDTSKMSRFAPLEEDLSCDVCIVGAGIVGLTTAYHLVRAGVDVVILDDGPVCGGETSRTTAHLTAVLDDRFQWLEQIHGKNEVGLSKFGHLAAINRIE